MPLPQNAGSGIVDRVEREHDRVVITRNGREAAVRVSAVDLAELEETSSVLATRGNSPVSGPQRRGTQRIFYRVRDETNEVIVLRVEHRADVDWAL